MEPPRRPSKLFFKMVCADRASTNHGWAFQRDKLKGPQSSPSPFWCHLSRGQNMWPLESLGTDLKPLSPLSHFLQANTPFSRIPQSWSVKADMVCQNLLVRTHFWARMAHPGLFQSKPRVTHAQKIGTGVSQSISNGPWYRTAFPMAAATA